jgi:hypothetical protein
MTDVRPHSQPRRVFLVGCPRSGTTLLQALLGAHSDIASYPESHIFIEGRRLAARFLPGVVARRNLARFYRILEKPLPQLPLAIAPRAYQERLIGLLDALTLAEGKELWIEKTPNHVLAIPRIRRFAPGSKFIHLVRDGRAVVASLYEVSRSHADIWGGPKTLATCVQEWNRAVLATNRALQTSGDGIVVHYDNLTRAPSSELMRLCHFLDLDYEPRMLEAYSMVTSSIVSSDEDWKSRVSAPIRDAGLAKYYRIFSPEQQRAIESSLIALPQTLL